MNKKTEVRTIKRQHQKYSYRRNALVATLEKKGIKNQKVLQAIETVPRHSFVDSALVNRAYDDRALPIGCSQTISQPYTVAIQTELLDPAEGDKVLEIGTGSGYQAAVLAEMGVRVYTIERHQELYHKAKELLIELGYRPEMKLGDGTLGWSAYAPYNGILVTAGAPAVPQDLIRQLEIGGRLIVPVGSQESQVMVRITRVSEDSYKEEHLQNFKFVPLIGEKGWD
ncbi:MAG TPA: protein-L-isoaspartate(D-aspartate) O-methyltransferase [Balneolaceae bacterium]|nr:protein-L-isoaspartate(D-aspartate) O-methyltransferase [Balneolaceae bacterium]